MKVAITSTDDNVASMIDPRFGRCAFFTIYDTESHAIEFLKNPAKESSEGAGPAAVQFIAKQKVNKVISGDFGMKIKSLFDSLHIEMQIEKQQDKTILSILKGL
jgi:predicted Fe-Mo cluster-binding NifX family protein